MFFLFRKQKLKIGFDKSQYSFSSGNIRKIPIKINISSFYIKREKFYAFQNFF